MEKRQQEILELERFTNSAESELTKILQSLQWDRKMLEKKPVTVLCKYDKHHIIPAEAAESHERKCFYKYSGYSKNDQLLPDLDEHAINAINLTQEEIHKIIHEASAMDPSFKKVVSCLCPELEHYLHCKDDTAQPMSLERLQCTYTADERRAIYDAVVKASPATVDPFDLAMFNEDGTKSTREREKSRLELEAELRDMKRRRVRYRGACPDSNYSHVLRGVIETQMETFTNAIKKEYENLERKPKNETREEKSDSHYKSHRPCDVKFRESSAIKPKPSSSYDNLNSSYEQERKRKHESGYHSKEEKYRRFYSKDYDDRRDYTNRAEKYEFDNLRTPKDVQPFSSKYREDRSKDKGSRESYDSYKKRKAHTEEYDKNRYKERDSKESKERKRHSYTDTHRKRRE